MEWLNYHHLLYFWVVAREGSITRATEELNLTQPTISAQLRLLEESLGEKLFRKEGRGLVLTEAGQLVFRYANEIFSLGRELRDTLKGRPTGRPARLVVGVADVVPKLVAYRLLEPAFEMGESVELILREDEAEKLYGALALHELDLVISDAPIPPGAGVRAFNHLLGESGISFFGTRELAQQFRKGFPRSLESAPLLMPSAGTELYRIVMHWFDRHDLRPRIVAEFEDSALMKMFGRAGHGLFPGPTAIEKETSQQYSVVVAGRAPELRTKFYVVSGERRIKHPAVAAITASGRQLFAER
jgi:LysR family transcriptional activator of nhaA